MDQPTSTKTRIIALLAGAGGVLVVAAIGVALAFSVADDDGRAATTTTESSVSTSIETTTMASTTTTGHTIPALLDIDPNDPNADVIADYERAVRSLFEANALSDPDYAALSETMQGEALERVRASIEVLRQQNQRSLFEGRIARIEILERTAAMATVSVCVVDEGRLVDATTGERLDDGSITLNASTDVLLLTGASWKLDHRVGPPDTTICDGVTP